MAGVEAMLDISQYILASRTIKIESHGSIPDELLKAGIINESFRDKMRQMLGFRNRAIHNYPLLDIEQLYDTLQKDVDDFKEFLQIIEKEI